MFKGDSWTMKRGVDCIVEKSVLDVSEFNHPNSFQSGVEKGRTKVDTEEPALVPDVDTEVPHLVSKRVGTKGNYEDDTKLDSDIELHKLVGSGH